MKNYIVIFSTSFGSSGLLVFSIDAVDEQAALSAARKRLMAMADRPSQYQVFETKDTL